MVVLAAINAKYIHSNLAVYSLKAYAEKESSDMFPEIRIAEYTINQPVEDIMGSLYEMNAQVVAFSCYIWNIEYVCRIARELKKVMPELQIWMGGPEVSYHAEEFLQQHSFVDLVMLGEGEVVFRRLVRGDARETISGIAYREQGSVRIQPPDELVNLNELPFVYQNMEDFEHKIVYYESSRGCPFRCSYCLSSIDKQVRFRNLDLVKQELQFFLNHRVPQVKFIDRTFNCNPAHAVAVWEYILNHDNGVTNFHFEISADLITEEELELLKQMRKGLIQLEIGLQTTNSDTVQAIERHMDIGRIKENMLRIHSFENIHQHLDLIAGLPYEDLGRFRQSFDEAYSMEAEQLQLGFLKVLKGSGMEELAEEYGLKYTDVPPYEVLSTNWLSYSDILELKRIEEMLEVYHNSGQFRYSLGYIMEFQNSAFDFFSQLGEYYKRMGYEGLQWKRLDRYNILRDFLLKSGMWKPQQKRTIQNEGEIVEWNPEKMDALLLHDLYLRENLKKRPDWARNYEEQKKEIAGFFKKSGRTGRMMHLEPWKDNTKPGYVLYDYEDKSEFDHSARAEFITEEEFREVLL